MAYLLLIIVVPLIAYTVWSVRQVREPWFDDAPRHAWATARASSADGVLVRLPAARVTPAVDRLARSLGVTLTPSRSPARGTAIVLPDVTGKLLWWTQRSLPRVLDYVLRRASLGKG